MEHPKDVRYGDDRVPQEATHHPEPWTLDYESLPRGSVTVLSADYSTGKPWGETMAAVEFPNDAPYAVANATRIVAAVNACANIPDDVLHRIGEQRAIRDRLEALAEAARNASS